MAPDDELQIWLAGDEREQRVARLTFLRSRSGEWQLIQEVCVIGLGGHSFAKSGPQSLNPERGEPVWISHYGAKLKLVLHFTKDSDALELTLTRD